MFGIFVRGEKIKAMLDSLGDRLENFLSERLGGLDDTARQTNRQARRNQAALESLYSNQNTIISVLRRMEAESAKAEALMVFAESFALWRSASGDSPEIRILSGKLDSLLGQFGLGLIDGTGDQFDPAKHEACAADYDPQRPENSVLEVIRPGFVRDGEILRCATVVVNRESTDAIGEIR